MSLWEDEATMLRLRELCADKEQSAATIAETLKDEFGLPFTRSAVAGKLNRMGVTAAQRQREYIGHRLGGRPRRAPDLPAPRAVVASTLLPPPPPSSLASVNGATFAVVALDETTRRCRWPIDDPRSAAFHFCCAETEPREIYCRFHKELSVRRG